MMITDVIVQKNFDAHACQEIVVLANKFPCETYICKRSQKANVKSIMGVISLMLKEGDHILLNMKGGEMEECTQAMLNSGWFKR